VSVVIGGWTPTEYFSLIGACVWVGGVVRKAHPCAGAPEVETDGRTDRSPLVLWEMGCPCKPTRVIVHGGGCAVITVSAISR
jgi:hypothetical protein